VDGGRQPMAPTIHRDEEEGAPLDYCSVRPPLWQLREMGRSSVHPQCPASGPWPCSIWKVHRL
jgi:hypothetical protein